MRKLLVLSLTLFLVLGAIVPQLGVKLDLKVRAQPANPGVWQRDFIWLVSTNKSVYVDIQDILDAFRFTYYKFDLTTDEIELSDFVSSGEKRYHGIIFQDAGDVGSYLSASEIQAISDSVTGYGLNLIVIRPSTGSIKNLLGVVDHQGSGIDFYESNNRVYFAQSDLLLSFNGSTAERDLAYNSLYNFTVGDATVLATYNDTASTYRPFFSVKEQPIGSLCFSVGIDVDYLDKRAGISRFMPAIIMGIALRDSVPSYRFIRPVFASMIVDDHSLNDFDFQQELLKILKAKDARAAFGFIPSYYEQTFEECRENFIENIDYWELIMHGNNHDEAELSTDYATSVAALEQSLARMENLKQNYGIGYERVEVFPYEEYIVETFRALRDEYFLTSMSYYKYNGWDLESSCAIFDFSNYDYPSMGRTAYTSFTPGARGSIRAFHLFQAPIVFYFHSHSLGSWLNDTIDFINELGGVTWKKPSEIVSTAYDAKYNPTTEEMRIWVSKVRYPSLTINSTKYYYDLTNSNSTHLYAVSSSSTPVLESLTGIFQPAFNLTSWNYLDRELNFRILSDVGAVATASIYCGEEDGPSTVKVNGVDIGFTYNGTTKLLAFNVTGSSTASDVEVTWPGGQAYIFQEEGYSYRYFFNSSDADFLIQWDSRFPVIATGIGEGGQVRAHSSYDYNLLPEQIGYALNYWEYENTENGDRVTGTDVTASQTIIRNASDFSLVKWEHSDSYMSHTYYYAFWKDKPYFWVYINRTMNQDMVVGNSQTCHMLTSILNKVWWTNYTGGVQNYNFTTDSHRYVQPIFSALDNGAMDRFPFMATYNDTLDLTVGFIYLDATPNIRKDTHFWLSEFKSTYMELQVDWGGESGGGNRLWRYGESMGMAYLVFIKSGDPYSQGNIVDYSKWLYNNATNVMRDADGIWSACHQTNARGWSADTWWQKGINGHTVYVANSLSCHPRVYYIPYMDMLPLTSKGTLDDLDFAGSAPLYSRWYFRHDSGGQIELDDSLIDESYNETIRGTGYSIGMMGWDKGDVTAYSHVEAFENSDKLLYFGNVTLDANSDCLNSTFILYFNRVDGIYKMSDTEYDIRFIDPIYGWSGIYLKVYSGTVQEYDDRLEIVLFNYSGPTSMPAGTFYEYNFTLWGHQGNATSMTEFFTQQSLTYRKLFQNFAAGDDTFGFESMRDYLISNSTFSSNTLTLYTINTTSNQKKIEIFVKYFGQPTAVKVNGGTVDFNWNSTTKILDFNSTFSGVAKIDVEWTDLNFWQFTFDHRDLDGNVVDSEVTWQLYDGSNLLPYTEGECTLLDGTYTLRTHYHGILINQTDLDTATFGNSTVTISLNMKPHGSVSGGYIAFNTTITSIAILSQTDENLTFTAEGFSPVTIIVDVPRNCSYIKRDGVNQTGWTYVEDLSNLNYTYISVTELSKWEYYFPPTPPEVRYVSGTVTDNSTGLPLADVEVTANGFGPVYTLTDGTYTIQVEVGVYTLTFAKAGYETAYTIVDTTAGNVSGVDFTLSHLEVQYIFGKTTIGGTIGTTPLGYVSAGRFQAPEDGTATMISAYITGRYTSGLVKALIYSDVGGEAGTLLFESEEITLSSSWAWHNFTVNCNIEAGQYYWFALLASVEKQFRHDPGLPNHHAYAWGWEFPSVPTEFSGIYGPNYANIEDSIFATYTPAEVRYVSGTVTDDATGLPLADVEVTANGFGPVYTLTDGTYTIQVGVGLYTLTFTKTGYQTAYASVDTTAGDVSGVNVALLPPPVRYVSGTVTDDSTGLPLADVAVTANGYGPVYTLADGTYTIQVGIGVYTLTFSKAGYETAYTDVDTTAGDVYDVDVALSPPPVRYISGTVTDSTTDLPLADVEVTANGYGPVYTLVDGTYTIQVGIGVYTLTFAKAGYETAYASVNTTAGDVSGVDIALSPPPIRYVSGTVTDSATGLPLADVEVLANGFGPVYTLADGTYSLQVGVGVYTLTFTKTGYEPADTIVDATAGNVSGVDVALSPLPVRHISGTVTDDATGLPLADVAVTANGYGPIYTLADGTYTIQVEIGVYTLTFTKAGYQTAYASVDTTAGDVYDVDVALSPPEVQYTFGKTTIGGTIGTTPLGYVSAGRFQAPEDGTAIMISAYITGRYTSGLVKIIIYSDVSGEAGSLLFESEEITLSSSWAWHNFTVNCNIEAGQYYWFALLASVEKQFRHDPGLPNHHAYAWGWEYPTAPAEFGGIYGPNYGSIEDSIYATYTPAEVRYVSGTVTDSATGLPLADVEVTANGFGPVYTLADGTYTIQVGVGVYTLAFTKAGYETAYTSVDTTAGDISGIDITLSPPPVRYISGTVTDDATGLPLADVAVTANGYGPVYTLADGTYTIQVGVGVYTVTFAKDGYESTYANVDATAGDVYGVDVALSPIPVQYVFGTVTDNATGLPLMDVEVTANGYGPVYTLTDGTYSLQVGAGVYTVTFTKSGYATSYSSANTTAGDVYGVDVALSPLPPSSTFGKTSVGGTIGTTPVGYVSAGRFQAPEDGTAIMISAYITGRYTSGLVKMIIYSDVGGEAGSLLFESEEITLLASWGWHNFTVNCDLEAGEYYWFAILASVESQYRHDPGLPSQHAYAWGWEYPSVPTEFGGIYGPNYANIEDSIYVTYTPT